MNFSVLRYGAIGLAILSGCLTVLLVSDPSTLGFSLTGTHWLGVIAGMLGVVQGFLPRVQDPARRVTDAGPPATSDLQVAADKGMLSPGVAAAVQADAVSGTNSAP